jgi:hypothetical protein
MTSAKHFIDSTDDESFAFYAGEVGCDVRPAITVMLPDED